MYANIATIPLQPGTADRCRAVLRDAEPRLRELPGFRGWLVLDDGAATVLSVSRWATEADREAAGASALVREAMAGLAPLLAGVPTRQAYRVLRVGEGGAVDADELLEALGAPQLRRAGLVADVAGGDELVRRGQWWRSPETVRRHAGQQR